MYLTKKLIFFELDSSSSLIINSLSGAIDKVPNHIALKLREFSGKESDSVNFDFDSGTLDYLKKRGYIFSSPGEEEQYLLNLYEKAKEEGDKSPVRFVICPTYSCNLRCKYCYEGTLGIEKQAILTEDQLEAIFTAIDKILAERPDCKSQVELFGGEPLLSSTKPIVEKLLSTLRDRRETLVIVSNGTNIQLYQDIFRENQDIIDSIQITLDGPREIHDKRRIYAGGRGSYDEIVQGIDYLLDLGINVRLRVNIDKENINYLKDFIALLEQKRWTYYSNFVCDVAPVTFHTDKVDSQDILPEDQAVKMILEMFPDMSALRTIINFGMFRGLNYVSSVLEPTRNYVSVIPAFSYCEATRLQCYVFGPENHIYICPDAIVDEKYAVGTYYPELEIDREKMAYWNRNILNIPQCKQCEVATFCGGGCALVPLCITDGEPACDNTKEVLLSYLEYWKDKMKDTGFW